jgi:hypothetical protein
VAGQNTRGNVAVNRGISVHVFSTVPDAERWLLETDDA